MELRVSVQNNSFRGLVARATTGSGGMLGNAGLVASCLAAVVGKYILLRPPYQQHLVRLLGISYSKYGVCVGFDVKG